MKCFLINLDRSPERLSFFDAQASKRGMPYERIPGVDGRQLSDIECDRMRSKSFDFQPINRGEIGLFLSHRLIWARLIEDDLSHAAVFEDDAVLSPDIDSVLKAIDTARPEVDVIKLETTGRKVVTESASQPIGKHHRLHKLLSWHGGTAGYVVTQGGARKLLEATWPLADPVDQVMFHPLSRVRPKLCIVQVEPSVCIQKNILEKSGVDPAFNTTIDRHTNRGPLLRHGLWVDLRRAWKKHLERRLRRRLASQPGHRYQAISGFKPLA